MSNRLQLFEEYLSRRKSIHTRKMYMMVVKKFLDFLEENKIKLDGLSLSHVEAFLSTFSVSDRSLSFYSFAVSSFLKFIGKPELASLVPVTKYEVKEPVWLPRNEVFNIIDKVGDEKNKVMLETAYEFALRVGEVVNVKWSDIDFENKTIAIERLKKRRKEKRIKPLSEGLLEKIKALPRLSEYVFPTYAGQGESGWHKMSTLHAERIFREAAKRAGYDEYAFHTLRHSRATEVAILTNGNIVEICKVTDHDDPRNVLIYTHISLKQMREIMDRRGK
jgi:integrase